MTSIRGESLEKLSPGEVEKIQAAEANMRKSTLKKAKMQNDSDPKMSIVRFQQRSRARCAIIGQFTSSLEVIILQSLDDFCQTNKLLDL